MKSSRGHNQTVATLDKAGLTESVAKQVAEIVSALKNEVESLPSELNGFSITITEKEMEELHQNQDKYLNRLVRVYLSSTVKEELGWMDLPPEFKIEWHGIKSYCYRRQPRLVVYGIINHPSADQFRDDLRSCVIAAAAAAGIAALSSGGAAAVAAFKAGFYSCITAKVGDWGNEVQLDVTTEKDSGNWTRC